MSSLLNTREEEAIEIMATHAFTKSQKIETRKIDWQGYGHSVLGQMWCMAD